MMTLKKLSLLFCLSLCAIPQESYSMIGRLSRLTYVAGVLPSALGTLANSLSNLSPFSSGSTLSQISGLPSSGGRISRHLGTVTKVGGVGGLLMATHFIPCGWVFSSVIIACCVNNDSLKYWIGSQFEATNNKIDGVQQGVNILDGKLDHANTGINCLSKETKKQTVILNAHTENLEEIKKTQNELVEGQDAIYEKLEDTDKSLGTLQKTVDLNEADRRKDVEKAARELERMEKQRQEAERRAAAERAKIKNDLEAQDRKLTAVVDSQEQLRKNFKNFTVQYTQGEEARNKVATETLEKIQTLTLLLDESKKEFSAQFEKVGNDIERVENKIEANTDRVLEAIQKNSPRGAVSRVNKYPRYVLQQSVPVSSNGQEDIVPDKES